MSSTESTSGRSHSGIDRRKLIGRAATLTTLAVASAGIGGIGGFVAGEFSKSNQLLRELKARRDSLLQDPNVERFNNHLQQVARAHSIAGVLGQRLAEREMTKDYERLFRPNLSVALQNATKFTPNPRARYGEHVPGYWEDRIRLLAKNDPTLMIDGIPVGSHMLFKLNAYTAHFGPFTPKDDREMRVNAMLRTEHPSLNTPQSQVQVDIERLNLIREIGLDHQRLNVTSIPGAIVEEHAEAVGEWVKDAWKTAHYNGLFTPKDDANFKLAFLGETVGATKRVHVPTEMNEFFNR